MGAGNIARPEIGLQAVDRVVRQPHGLRFILETDGDNDGAEDFFLGDLHAVGDLLEDGGFDIGAAGVLACLVAAGCHFGTLGAASLDVTQHAVHLVMVDDSTHGGGGIERIGRRPRLGVLRHKCNELVLDLLLHQNAGGRVAALAGVEEHAIGRDLGDVVQIACIGKHDVGRLAAGFERHVFHVALAGIAQEVFSHLGRAGEGHHIDVHVAAQRLARGLAKAGDDLQHTIGNAGLGGEFGNAQRRQGRLLGRFDDDGIAGSKGWPQLPRCHHQRVVPRHHGGDNADRLAGDERD